MKFQTPEFFSYLLICFSLLPVHTFDSYFNNREKENEYLPMEGVEVEKKDKNIHGYAPDDSPRVNESGSKEPILAAQGAEKPDQYTERYVLDNGTEYSTVVTRGKDHMPGVSETKKAPKDKNKSKVIF